ncbi:hypothetical protein KNT59_gp212 [Klebsiella phage KPV15]|uniref:Uncharacterized protein n=1 Tax=Klebsiella phage KPV15 TaxID=1913572 RepID=A0A1J0MHF7_9CAUD|nr:hypothetical protein KNT59_gp212 [Klebsiella phage KPV15]APD20611.1 hypothetical protein [Klebsiella phage KPV15]
MEKGKFYKLKREPRLSPGALIKGVFEQIGNNPIKITRTFKYAENTGLVEFEIIKPDGEYKRVSVDEVRFSHMWCILTNQDFSIILKKPSTKNLNRRPMMEAMIGVFGPQIKEMIPTRVD